MINLDGILFDKYEGVIEIPKISSRPFSATGTPGTGIHLQPIRPVPFTLRLWYHDRAVNLESNQRGQINRIGREVYLVANGVDYSRAPYRLRWHVVDVSIIDADLVIHASGVRGFTRFSFTPASRVISQWTLLAVPM